MALMGEATGRAECKRLGQWLDEQEEPQLLQAIVREAQRRGVVLQDDAITLPGKRLLRLAQGREEAARVRSNPIVRDEAFRCVQCGEVVPPHGRTARDHCPNCLTSLHVDIIPGDRAESCKGVLTPVGLEFKGETPVIFYRCERCGKTSRNQAVLDGEVPDSWEQLMALSQAAGP
jgi:DNA-directed RNA polymerase subunit RPC12/RpoP